MFHVTCHMIMCHITCQMIAVSDNKGTSLFVVVNHFVKDISHSSIYQVASLFTVKLEENIFTPREIDDFNRSVTFTTCATCQRFHSEAAGFSNKTKKIVGMK